MKTLLNFTPRLVMAVILIVLFCPSLMANQTVAPMSVQEQSTAGIIAGFMVLLLVILLPLMKKRNVMAGK